jgi:hypothetical protein
MVNIRILAVATICAILALATIMPQGSPATVASAATVPEVGPGFVLPGSDTSAAQAGKYPSVVGVGTTVNMVANTNQAAMYWSKQDTAATAASPLNFGGTDGDTDYTEAAIAAAPDGTVYAVWVVQRYGINMKRKPAGGDWEATKSIYRTGSFMAYIDIAVSSSGQIFVIWNQDNYYRYTTSTDGSNTWSGAGVISSKKPYKSVFVAAGANNSEVVAFGSGDGNAYAAVWNGSGFDSANLTPFKTSGDFFASAKPVIAPNGKIYIAFRNAGGGLYYTERQTDGSWPVSKLAGGKIYDAIGVGVDIGNNLHFSWSSDASGSWQLYYAFKPVAGDWQGPVKAPGISDKVVSDVDLSTTIGARSYGHAVFETFNGSGAAIRYQQFSSLGVGPSATPVIENGATPTGNASVSVSFTNVTDAPDGVRYHWDAAPTDADAWATFQTISIPRPAGISAAACETHTLYTQVRKGATNGAVAQASKIFDIAVQADVTILNRHLIGLSPIYDLSTSEVYTGPGGNGASDGDPNYTREASFDLGIRGQNDCSGLKTYNILGSESGTITNNSRHRAPALPGVSTPGPRDVSVQVTDGISNTQTWLKTLIYDPADTDPSTTVTNTDGLPVLASGGSVTADDANSIIRVLSFKNISVDDNLYGQQANLPPQLSPGKQFWGVWIANTTSPTITVDDPSLNWYPVRVPTPNSSFTVTWDLFSGLGITTDMRNRPGDYYVFVRFLDGAGNASTRSLSKVKVTLTAGYDIPTQRLPVLIR